MPHSKVPHSTLVALQYNPSGDFLLVPSSIWDDGRRELCLFCFGHVMSNSIKAYLDSAEGDWDGTTLSGSVESALEVFGQVRPHDGTSRVFEYDPSTGLLKPED